MIVTNVVAATGPVLIVKLGDASVPAGTITLAGTAATVGWLLDKKTVAPARGAGPFSLTKFNVPAAPAVSDAGDSTRLEISRGDTVKSCCARRAAAAGGDGDERPDGDRLSGDQKSGDVVAPSGTTTETGTAATDGLLLESVTAYPPGGAGAFSNTRLSVVVAPP